MDGGEDRRLLQLLQFSPHIRAVGPNILRKFVALHAHVNGLSRQPRYCL